MSLLLRNSTIEANPAVTNPTETRVTNCSMAKSHCLLMRNSEGMADEASLELLVDISIERYGAIYGDYEIRNNRISSCYRARYTSPCFLSKAEHKKVTGNDALYLDHRCCLDLRTGLCSPRCPRVGSGGPILGKQANQAANCESFRRFNLECSS
mgnify:CR=1 FL=1